MLLIIFVETVMHKHVILFYVMFFDEYKAWKKQHLFEIEIFCDILNFFTVIFNLKNFLGHLFNFIKCFILTALNVKHTSTFSTSAEKCNRKNI